MVGEASLSCALSIHWFGVFLPLVCFGGGGGGGGLVMKAFFKNVYMTPLFRGGGRRRGNLNSLISTLVKLIRGSF